MASIHKGRTKRKGYDVRWRTLSGASRRRWCPTKESAEQLRSDVILAKSRGRDWEPTPEAPAVVERGLEEAVQTYLTAMRRRWAAHTYANALTTFGALFDLAPDAKVGSLSRSLLETYFDRQRAKCSEATSVFRARAVEKFWRWLAGHEDWAEIVPRPCALDLPTPTSKIVPWAPSWADMDAVAEAARGHSWYGRLFAVLRYTGLRVSQVMRLEWRDADLDAETLIIRGELGKSKSERRGRIVPISPYLVEELAGWGVREGFLVDVSKRDYGGKIRERRTADSEVMHTIWLEAVGRRPTQPSHGFRRGIITNLQALGAPFHLVQYLVGHSQTVTGDVYTDPLVMFPALREVVALIPAVGVQGVVGMKKRGAR